MSVDTKGSIYQQWYNQLNYTSQAPKAHGLIKQTPEDFHVSEVLGFEPEPNEAGQHHWLFIEKEGINTADLIQYLSRVLHVHPKHIGYSGLKDKHAVTRQWCSVEVPVKTQPDWSKIESHHIRLLQHVQSTRKLKRGSHQGNLFTLRLKQIDQPDIALERLANLRQQGAPNYFTEQRFGIGFYNLVKTEQLFTGRAFKNKNLKSLLLSSARSYIFNSYLSQRLQKYGDQLLIGDAMQLAGTRSFFIYQGEPETLARYSQRDIIPTGPMYGLGISNLIEDALTFEQACLVQQQMWCQGLEQHKLQAERRALWAFPKELEIQHQNNNIELQFYLPKGSYATAILREVIQYG